MGTKNHGLQQSQKKVGPEFQKTADKINKFKPNYRKKSNLIIVIELRKYEELVRRTKYLFYFPNRDLLSYNVFKNIIIMKIHSN